MRGTLGPERVLPHLDALSPGDRRLLMSTTLSSEAALIDRFGRHIVEDSYFPYEGALDSHTVGSIIRFHEMTHQEDVLRAHRGIPLLSQEPTMREPQFLTFALGIHDLGELSETGDIPQGGKTDRDREQEARDFLRNLEQHSPNHRTLARGQRLHELLEGDTPLRRAFKMTEHAGFAEIAIRLHRRDILGEPVVDLEEDERSGVYLARTIRTDAAGNPVRSQLHKPHSLIWDITKNSLGYLSEHSREFLVARQYVAKRRDELRSMVEIYLGNIDQSLWLQEELLRRDPKLKRSSQQELTEIYERHCQFLESVKSVPLNEITAGYKALEDGTDVSLTNSEIAA